MSAPRPYTLVAELTHRCPLHCPYCSNPLALAGSDQELSTATWCEVLEHAEALGVMQLHLTGGEPLARADLEAITAKGHALGLYTNLITSGIPLTRERLTALRDAGIDNVQVSFQDVDAARSDAIAGYPAFEKKLAVVGWVKELGLPLTINVVLHRANLGHVEAIVRLAEELRADRLELANTQYQGWAFPNREALVPTRAQLDEAHAVAAAAKARLEGTMEVLYVKPDYFGAYPRACMDGWARRFIVVAPDGRVLPCHAATAIDSLHFESVRDRSLTDIWETSPALLAYRGDAWMPEPCRSCARKSVDFGGCRCQAFQLTGDASATDPACSLAPSHALVEEARTLAESGARRYVFRGR
jgi:pyrroloquinoline quinone biosynthesis protein E